ncbi:MAG: response regulator transcription factor [Flavobacteriaceae bacterium]|nr:response regulator transcription factor [Flavobacteriaceae bacterium]
MQKLLFYCILLLNVFVVSAQFQFSGEVTDNFKDATAYLTIVDEYQKSDLLLTEKIIQECKIDSLQQFLFKGDFLASKNMLYKIHVDTCNDEISDSKHLLNHCETSHSILFIANNTDTVFFPLNDLSQLFCEIKQSSTHNTAILEINALQETLLNNLQSSKSDAQRTIIYKNCFQKLKEFSKSFDDPLVELYTYHLYANEKSFSRSSYLADLKSSNYYADLLERLTHNYPKSDYVKQFTSDLKKDQYTFLEPKNADTSITLYIIGALLVISIIVNIVLFQKTKVKKEPKVDYKTILTPQEQKVFELMHQKSSNKIIADSLFISVSTVKTHINNIYSKLNISSRKEVDVFFD